MTTKLFRDSITSHYDITLLFRPISTYFDLFRHMMSRNVSKTNFGTDGAPYHQACLLQVETGYNNVVTFQSYQLIIT